MKAHVEIDVYEVIDGLNGNDTVELAKRLARNYLDVSEQLQTIIEAGYTFDDILDEIGSDIIEKYVEKKQIIP